MPDSGKILGVMSDLFFTVTVMDAAKKLGFTAEFVKDKTLALEKARSNPPLIVLDLNCAAVDPLALIAAIKSSPANAGTPMIAFVSHVQVDLKQKALDAGCDTVVARSVFAEKLAELLATAAKSRGGWGAIHPTVALP